jgi:hypothetical protein
MITVTVPGADADFNDDGDVDADDLGTWKGAFGSAATPTTGDADGDGDADGEDFLVWQRTVTSPAAAAAVPEPTAAALALLGGLLWHAVRRSTGRTRAAKT